MIPQIFEKIDGYRRRAFHEVTMARFRAGERRKRAVLDAWIDGVKHHPPEVLIGANFAEFGGVRHHIEAIIRHSHHRVEMVPPPKVARTLTPHDLSSRFSNEFMAFRAPGVRVIHSHVYPWFIHWCHARQREGLRWIHTYHLNYYAEHARGPLDPWQQGINDSLLNVAPQADLCLSVSKWQLRQLLEQYGIKSEYVPNGVDVSLSDRANASRFVRKTGLRDFVLYVGRNDPVKNPVDFVRLTQRLPNRTCVMIGGGLCEQTLRSDWDIEVPPNLFVLGALSHPEVQDAIAASAVLVVTSKREGLPTLVMEGMAARKPVVVPEEAGCVETIGEGDCGYIYRPQDIDDLVEKTMHAMTDTRIGARARQRVLQEYDWRVVAKQLDGVYQQRKRGIPCG